VKELIDANGVRILVELLTLAHLHVSRATVPMQVSFSYGIGKLQTSLRGIMFAFGRVTAARCQIS
jgi:hypothetical protein